MNANISHLSPSDIVAWFRAKANELNKMADEVEHKLNAFTQESRSPMLPNLNIATISKRERFADFDIIVENAHKALSSNKMRIGDLAKLLGLKVEGISNFIAEENGFLVNKRGWVSSDRAEYPQSDKDFSGGL